MHAREDTMHAREDTMHVREDKMHAGRAVPPREPCRPRAQVVATTRALWWASRERARAIAFGDGSVR
jgi:hypothetical protein